MIRDRQKVVGITNKISLTTAFCLCCNMILLINKVIDIYRRGKKDESNSLCG